LPTVFGAAAVRARQSAAGRNRSGRRIVFMDEEQCAEYLAEAEKSVEKTKDLTRKQEEQVKELTKLVMSRTLQRKTWKTPNVWSRA
jgi:hypothetical protein